MDTLIQTGEPAPDFTLPDLKGILYHLHEGLGRILILNFWSAECPWAERADRELLQLLAGWGPQVALWTIASNANEPLEMVAGAALARGLPLVLVDTDQQVADRYGAVTTPHLFVVDVLGVLRYQGAFDDVTFRQRTPTRPYLRQAVDAILAGRDPQSAAVPPYGCTIVRYCP